MKYDGPTDIIKQDSALPNRNNYTYIGSILEPQKGSKTKFIFHCSECAKDPELFATPCSGQERQIFKITRCSVRVVRNAFGLMNKQ